jgi:hypothetical protein
MQLGCASGCDVGNAGSMAGSLHVTALPPHRLTRDPLHARLARRRSHTRTYVNLDILDQWSDSTICTHNWGNLTIFTLFYVYKNEFFTESQVGQQFSIYI